MLLPRASSGPPAAGVLRSWPAVLVTWGPGGVTRLHAHRCWHLIVGLEGDLSIATGAGARARRAGAVITAPDTPHAVDARGTRALIVFVEPAPVTPLVPRAVVQVVFLAAVLVAGLAHRLRPIPGARSSASPATDDSGRAAASNPQTGRRT